MEAMRSNPERYPELLPCFEVPPAMIHDVSTTFRQLVCVVASHEADHMELSRANPES